MKKLLPILTSFLALSFSSACFNAPPAEAPDPREAAASGTLSIDPENATITGIYETPITLVDGLYEVESFAEGRLIGRTVTLVSEIALRGDLDGDGVDEAVGFVVENSGGTGIFLYVFALRSNVPGSISAQPIGDRVDIREARIENGAIVLDVVQGGPGDAACCPTQLARRSWTLADGALAELPALIQGTISIETLRGTSWRFSRYGYEGPALADSTITLEFDENGARGFGGCNQYNAAIEQGENPADVRMGPLTSTKKLCPGGAMQQETEFLAALQRANHFEFGARSLYISYEAGGEQGVLFFVAAPPPSAN